VSASETVPETVSETASEMVESRWDPRARSRSELWNTTVPQVAALVLCIVYALVMYRLVWLRHERFGSFDYDLGMYDQGIWQLAHGRGFMTVRGMHVFGHHANFGYLLLVPFYWIGAGPHFLNAVNTIGVVACCLPLYFMAKRGLRSDWAGLAVCFVFLFHYVPQWMINETFHPENLAAPFIIGAVYLAIEGRWRGYWWCIGLAMIWKEDVALVTAVLGVVLIFMTREFRRGALTVVVSAIWFVVCLKLVIPFFSPDGAVFDGLFGELGKSATDVVFNSVRQPSLALRILQEHGAEAGALDMMRPYAFTSFAAPHLMLLGLPQHVVNFLSVQSFTWETKFHYAMFPFVGITLAAVRGATTRSRRWVGWAMVVAMVVGVVATRNMGVGPWSNQYAMGFWPLTEDPVLQPARERAVAQVRPDDVVSAPYFLVPHLSQREEVYTFPNPWKPNNFGARPGVRRDPARVDVVIMQPMSLQGDEVTIWNGVIATGEFSREAAFGSDIDPVEVWRRTSPPRVPGTTLEPTG